MALVEPSDTKKAEPKVKAAALGTYVLGVLGVALFGALNQPDIIAGLPDYVTAILVPLIPTIGAYVSGYSASHQYREPAPIEPLA